jgi:hypothetical protein
MGGGLHEAMDDYDQRHPQVRIESHRYVQKVAPPGVSACQLAVCAEEGPELADRPREAERTRCGAQD